MVCHPSIHLNSRALTKFLIKIINREQCAAQIIKRHTHTHKNYIWLRWKNNCCVRLCVIIFQIRFECSGSIYEGIQSIRFLFVIESLSSHTVNLIIISITHAHSLAREQLRVCFVYEYAMIKGYCGWSHTRVQCSRSMWQTSQWAAAEHPSPILFHI